MSRPRDPISWLLLAFALACWLAAVFPQWAEWTDPATGDKITEHRFGLWDSPIFNHERREFANGGFRMESGMRLLSWSFAVLMAGVGAWEVFRLRIRKGNADRT